VVSFRITRALRESPSIQQFEEPLPVIVF
jgi:hypothetical protein